MRRALLAAVTLAWSAVPPVRAQSPVPLYPDLGNHHHAISTKVAKAQQYFDQGLRLTYGFNHAEAIRSFRAAQAADPKCAMCFWGEALVFGPNINAALDSASGVAAVAAMQRAAALSDNATAKERAFIAALAKRYAADPTKGQAARDTQYARAMQMLVEKFPNDDDAHALHAEGRWQDVLAEPSPPADLPYPLGVWHYARTLAFVATGDVSRTETELRALKMQRESPAGWCHHLGIEFGESSTRHRSGSRASGDCTEER